MARELHYSSKKSGASTSSIAPRLLISLLCLASLLLCFSLFRNDVASPSLTYSAAPEKIHGNCNHSDGRWIYDHSVRSPPRYDQTCKEIFKGWNCIAGNKSNAIDILKWRWKPYGCNLAPFEPLQFLENFRDTNIGFVGDSLNRNMFVSLFCTLKQFSAEVKKWRPVGADRGFTFVKYNLTIAYHRTNLLARYGGQPVVVVVCWSRLVIRRAIELTLIYQTELGQKLQVSTTYSYLIQDTGGGLLQSLIQ
ncbi:hypothetical protein ABFX02_02G048300 [Erythranthe guttata]